MNKYMFVYHGQWDMRDEVKDAWMKWFAEIGDSVVDGGNPFGRAREVTPTGSRDLPADDQAAVGYTIVGAETMEDAEKLLANCPMVSSVRIYEAAPM